jgi:adenosylmethionine-8-amino-7-oxononanoate aminotransferase
MVEVVADKDSKAKFDPSRGVGPKLQAATRARGVIVRCTNDGLALTPPLTIQRPELDTVVGAIAESLDEVLGQQRRTSSP